jgi:hypothetical protein
LSVPLTCFVAIRHDPDDAHTLHFLSLLRNLAAETIVFQRLRRGLPSFAGPWRKRRSKTGLHPANFYRFSLFDLAGPNAYT